MAANKKLLFLPGDGIGPEVVGEVRRVIDWMADARQAAFDITEDLVGGAAIDAHGVPLPLTGAKANDFRIFADICKKVQANLHLNREQLMGIVEQAYEMNPSGKRKHDKRDLLRKLGELKV